MKNEELNRFPVQIERKGEKNLRLILFDRIPRRERNMKCPLQMRFELLKSQVIVAASC